MSAVLEGLQLRAEFAQFALEAGHFRPREDRQDDRHAAGEDQREYREEDGDHAWLPLLRRAECTIGSGQPSTYTPAVRVVRVAVLLALVLPSAACLVVGLQPAYEPETIAFDPSLLGDWASDEDGVSVTIERGEWHSYHLVLSEREKTTRLSARMTRAGELLLLDVTPLDGTDVEPLQLPVHGIFRITLDNDVLSVASLDYDRFLELASRGEPGFTLDGRKNVVITLQTAELRRWLEQHAADAGVFSTATVLKRIAAESPPPQ